MGMSKEIQDEARREWRELGFFFNYDKAARKWTVVGNTVGLRRFRKILADYASDPRHEPVSEHEHYGPYQDLKLVTWRAPEIRSDGIYGRLEDFARLADAVDRALDSGAATTTLSPIFVGATGAAENELEIRVASDDFDPAVADDAFAN